MQNNLLRSFLTCGSVVNRLTQVHERAVGLGPVLRPKVATKLTREGGGNDRQIERQRERGEGVTGR